MSRTRSALAFALAGGLLAAVLALAPTAPLRAVAGLSVTYAGAISGTP
jgi:hypothetical protein